MPDEPKPAAKPLREKDKSELVIEVMRKPHGIPSYKAWDMTVDELRDKLKGA